MAVLSKNFEAFNSLQENTLEEILFTSNKLFFETFPDVIVYFQEFCSVPNSWEIHYLIHRYLHRELLAKHEDNSPRMALPVFESPKEYFKMTDLKDVKVLHHLVIFKTALSSLCFRSKPSAKKPNFSQALFTRIKDKLCTREPYFNLRAKKNHSTDNFGQEARPVLRLRGGANGDEEKWLCNVCGKTLVSKRNLDQHMNSVHVNHPDFTCITSADGLLKWKCCFCNNLLSSKQRIISHLEKSHGKTNFQQANKQTYNSRTTLWRNRKRSPDGCFVSEQVCSSPCSSLDISESCPVSDKDPLLPQGASPTSFSQF